MDGPKLNLKVNSDGARLKGNALQVFSRIADIEKLDAISLYFVRSKMSYKKLCSCASASRSH